MLGCSQTEKVYRFHYSPNTFWHYHSGSPSNKGALCVALSPCSSDRTNCILNGLSHSLHDDLWCFLVSASMAQALLPDSESEVTLLQHLHGYLSSITPAFLHWHCTRQNAGQVTSSERCLRTGYCTTGGRSVALIVCPSGWHDCWRPVWFVW